MVRDKEYVAAPDAKVAAHVIGPDGSTSMVEMTAVPSAAGTFAADWTAEKPGSYVAEITAGRGNDELGKDVVTFSREDGVAENFHTGAESGVAGEAVGGDRWAVLEGR